MKPEDVSKNFSVILELLIKWWACVCNPINTALIILTQGKDKVTVLKAATSLWATAIFLSTILEIPMYQRHGISWSNVGFHLTHQLVLFTGLFMHCLSFYVGFRIFKIRGPFIDLFVLSAVVIGVYSPILTLLMYPSSVRILDLLAESKGAGFDVDTALFMTSNYMATAIHSGYFGAYAMTSGVLLMVFTFGLYALQLQILSNRWDVDKPRLFNAAAFGFCVVGVLLAPPLMAFGLFTLYSFL